MFALLIPLVLTLAPQLAGMIFGSKGADATAKVAALVQDVVGTAANLEAPGGVAAAVAHIQANPLASADLVVRLTDLQLQMQKEQDNAAQAIRQDALDELRTRLADTGSARTMATDMAKMQSGLAYGGVIVSVVIVVAFGWTTYSIFTTDIGAANGQFGSMLVGTLAAMATQVANYWLGSSQGSNAKNALLANAQNTLASSVPGDMVKLSAKH